MAKRQSIEEQLADADLWGETWGLLDDRAKGLLADWLVEQGLLVLEGITRTADPDEGEDFVITPIEQLFAVALSTTIRKRPNWRDFWFNMQYPIATKGGCYRVDFFIALERSDPLTVTTLIVECDGHDFHEKTKDQARRDKKRDRDLKAISYDVIHFTGSEIWRNPYGCVNEALSLLQAIAERSR